MPKRTCSIDGCEKPHEARGWFASHYNRWLRHGDPTAGKPSRVDADECSIEGCASPPYSRGWCVKHYQRWRAHGDPLGSAPKGPTVCAVDGCEGRVTARGWCNSHYARWKRHGDPLAGGLPHGVRVPCSADDCTKNATSRGMCATHYQRWKATRTDGPRCSMDDCDRPVQSRDLCRSHYERWRYTGGDPVLKWSDVEGRFWSYVERGTDDECWPWTGVIIYSGYGVFGVDGGRVVAHRYAYELVVGPIPEGMHLDHVCHTNDETCYPTGVEGCLHRRCVNPAHLEPVTPRENARRQHRIYG